jgi:hypothetical protein
MAFEKVSFFDRISANKRNSLILILFLSIVFLAAVWAFSYLFDFGIMGLIIGFIALIFYAVSMYYAGDRVILAISL